MRMLIQRVSMASVIIDQSEKSRIGKGLLIFIGITNEDTQEDIDWLSNKTINLRIFDDAASVPNLSVNDINGDILLVSQFTLHALTKKGNRPGYSRAARPEQALPLYQSVILKLEALLGKIIFTGTFGADMKVQLINDGPITIWLDSKNKDY